MENEMIWLTRIILAWVILLLSIPTIFMLKKKLKRYFSLEIVVIGLGIPLILSFILIPEEFIEFFPKNYFIGILIIALILISFNYYLKIGSIKRMNEKEFRKYKKRETFIKKKAWIIVIPVVLSVAILEFYFIFWYGIYEIEPIFKNISYLYLFFITIFIVPISYTQFRLFFKTKNYTFALFPILTLVAGLMMFYSLHELSLFYLILSIPIILLGFLLIKKISRRKGFVYRNLITDVSDEIDSMTDAYSEIHYTKKSEKLLEIFNNKNLEKMMKEYGKTMINNGVFIDFDIKKDIAIYYLPTFSLGNIFFNAIFSKSKLSYVTLDIEGLIKIFISKADYESIAEPVTYDTLCKRLAEIFEKSFIKFLPTKLMNLLKY